MVNEAKKYTITLGDQRYTIISDEPADRLAKAVDLINSLINSGSDMKQGFDAHKVISLIALQLATKLIALEAVVDEMKNQEHALLRFIDHEIAGLL